MNCTRVVSKGEIAKVFGAGGGTQIKLEYLLAGTKKWDC